MAIATGACVFYVGTAVSAAITGPASLSTRIPLLQYPIEPVFRWFILLAAMSLVGGISFELFVARPILMGKDSRKQSREIGNRLFARMSKVIWTGMAVFVLASVGQLLLQAAAANRIPVLRALGGPAISFALHTNLGDIWLWRIVLVVATAAALPLTWKALFGQRDEEDGNDVWEMALRWAALLFGAGALLTMSFGSHGAAASEVRSAAVFSDYVHLLAASFWVGGLFHLALAIPLILRRPAAKEQRAILLALVPRFSVMAGLCVGTLILTGLYSSWVQVTVLRAVATPYGFALLAKIGLIVPLLLLGALNLLWVRPRLARKGQAGQWLRKLVIGEAVIAVLVLLAVGMLVSLEPARQAASLQQTRKVSHSGQLNFSKVVEGADIRVVIDPGRLGANTVLVTLKDHRGNPIVNATDVTLTLKYLKGDLEPYTESTLNHGGGLFIAHGGNFSLAGPWQAQIKVMRPDAFDARVSFDFNIGAVAGASNSTAIVPARDTGKVLWGLELAALGCLFLGTSIALRGWKTRPGFWVLGIGAVSFLAGLVLIVNVYLAPPGSPGASTNPVSTVPQSTTSQAQVASK